MTYDQLDDRGSIRDLQGRVDWDSGRCENNLAVLLSRGRKWEIWVSTTGLAGFVLYDDDAGVVHAPMYTVFEANRLSDPNRDQTTTFTSRYRR